MRKHNQDGSTSVVVSILLSILLIGAGSFAYWAYSGRQDYKNNSDKKVADAVSAAEKAQATKLNQQFAEESKNPNKAYIGPSAFGSITFNYPKTWSAYVDESSVAQPINGYFSPDKVPGVSSGAAFALRLELVTGNYAQIVQQLNSQVKLGKIKAAAYVPPKVNGVANVQPGTRFDGQLVQTNAGPLTGSMVVIQVRDKVLKIYTLSNSYLNDFNNIVLPSLTFIP
jgi:hypothetical protein